MSVVGSSTNSLLNGFANGNTWPYAIGDRVKRSVMPEYNAVAALRALSHKRKLDDSVVKSKAKYLATFHMERIF